MNQILELDEGNGITKAHNEVDLAALRQKLDSGTFGEKCALKEKPED